VRAGCGEPIDDGPADGFGRPVINTRRDGMESSSKSVELITSMFWKAAWP
jgi:hypothetical protein